MHKTLWLFCLFMTSTYLICQEPEPNFYSPESFAETNFSPCISPCTTMCSHPWLLRLEGGYAAGKLIGLKHNYGELGIFTAAKICNGWFSLADVRGYRLDNGNWAASAGLGVRFLMFSNRALGANLYYDYRETRLSNFQRIGVGLESLGTCLDFRLNGYFPVNKDTHRSRLHIYNDYIGDYTATCRKYEFAFKGLDAEVGWHMFQWCDLSLYGAIGPYYYHHNHRKVSHIFGGQARLELNWKDYITFRLSASHDNKFNTEVQGKIMISFPLADLFYCGCAGYSKYLLTQPVERNAPLFTQSCCDWTWNW